MTLRIDAQVISRLRHLVIDHNQRYPEAQPARLDDLKRIFRLHARGPMPDEAAMQSVQRHLDELRQRCAPPLVDMGQCEALADYYLTTQDHGRALFNIINGVRRYTVDATTYARGKGRRDLLQGAAKHARGLANALGQLDHRALVEAMARGHSASMSQAEAPSAQLSHSTEGRPTMEVSATTGVHMHRCSHVPLLISELQALISQLAILENGLNAAARGTFVPHGRPPRADPLVFGVEQLALLWSRVHNVPPTQSFKARSFGDLVLRVMGSNGLGFGQSEIETTVRSVAETI